MEKTKIFVFTCIIVLCVLFLSFEGTAYGQDTLELHQAIMDGNLELAKKLITEKKELIHRANQVLLL